MHKFILLNFKRTGFGYLFGKYDSTDFDNSCSLICKHTTLRKRTLDIQFNTIHALLLISLLKEKDRFPNGLFLNRTGKNRIKN